jgi:hypothetical protein
MGWHPPPPDPPSATHHRDPKGLSAKRRCRLSTDEGVAADALLAPRRRSPHDEVIVQHKNVHEWRGSGSEANGRPAVASSSFSDPYRRPMWVTATRSFGFYGGNGTRLVFLPDAQQTRVGQAGVFKPPRGIP